MADQHVRHWLDQALRRGGWVRGVKRAEAVIAWPTVVGGDVARFAQAVAFNQGTLVVEVSDSETATHLGMQRAHILSAYRERMPELGVRDVRFRVGRIAPPTPAAAAPTPAADPHERARLQAVADALPATVADGALALGETLARWRAQRRAEGWVACRLCQGLTPPQRSDARGVLCTTCERTLSLPKVQRAAAQMTVDPSWSTPELTDDERRAAVDLALATLRERTVALLPRVIADPRERELLSLLLRCTLALHRGGALASIDEAALASPMARGLLDARALRVLGISNG